MRRPSQIELELWRMALGAARHVNESWRFALNEALLRNRTRRYTLRRSGRQVIVRHPIVDACILAEVLDGSYDVPDEVLNALAGSHPLRIGELGGHIGTATLTLIERFPGATVTVFEPHPDNARILAKVVEANRLEGRVEIHVAAAATHPGELRMDGYSALAHYARDEDEVLDRLPFFRAVLDAPNPVTVESVDVFPSLADCDLLKIDIEGAEWPILSDPRFARLAARAVVMEYHGWGAPGPDAAQAVKDLLTRAGFTVGEPFDVRPDEGLIWAWKPASPAS